VYRIYPLAELLIFFALLRLEMSLPISQPLAADAFKRIVGRAQHPQCRVSSDCCTGSQIRQIAMQVL